VRRAAQSIADIGSLLKLRVNVLVALTALAGYRLGVSAVGLGQAPGAGSAGAGVPSQLLTLLVGTLLLASGSSALNQYLERRWDALMTRTRARPLPSGRMQPAQAQAVGVLLVAAGALSLLLVNPLTAVLGCAAAGSYLFLYTPLKRRTSLSLLVGAVAGAVPPLMGWSAATADLGGAGWSLFGVVFLWQVPHFLAIAWLHREDYARAGFRMLTVVEPTGRTAGFQALSYSILLAPVALVPAVFGLVSPLYTPLALVLSAGLTAAAAAFLARRGERSARALLYSSLLYLPLLFLGLLATAY
jgi:protoheme IX farnesyltransferase